ncbi:rhomboid family protein [Staphylococcus epidermidis]|jgi:rhomboid family protein|uniref:rhomboid family protein n=2 Tax=Staphylococcus epidermidis TaxID=1282 RepID=UPI0002431DDF|nr:rhomboid family intramembrane serine protease [Staphylococcus epidermidis]EHM69289.1 peptidase, S54 family [Staphylococcus epidermidis VCU071]KAB2193441.1 rhomboid family intramembrane serine protease [Staphylococcus epidermidis]MBC3168738.1 rhomboid family intramembrane serine protease [Staphylococcus epidermidis]MBM0767745.1 rhomboid family intramembrane serine protease [Staphylococcus epidermidis]MBM0778545.1 rhomboid family intramembrane serine protease [Staphylococcus epidermidis]
MNINKLYWKALYYWIRYLNYNVIYRDKEDDEIWLSHKRKHSIVVFRKDVTSTQEIRFDKSKIMERPEEIQQFIGYIPESYEFYYFTDKELSKENLNEEKPIKLKFKIISNEQSLKSLPINFLLLKMLINNEDKRTYLHYKRKVLTQNLVDKHMQRFTPITYTLILINIVIWLCMILYLNRFSDVKLLEVGGLVHFNVVHGEWYRLISSMFLHFNFEHILMNMLSLFIFGKIVESIIGSWRMLIIYIISGLYGNFVSLSFNTTTISVGASGAIFGLIGSIFVIMYLSKNFNKKMIGQLLIALFVLIVFSLFMSNINIMAHLGGFISGVLITLIGYYFKTQRSLFWSFLIVFLLIFIILQIRIFTISEDNIYDKLIRDEMIKGNYSEAKNVVKQTLNNNYADDETYYLSGLITATKSSQAEAVSEWERGLRKFPNSGVLNYELAIANRSLSDDKKALKYIKKAVAINPNNKKYVNLKKELSKSNDTKN